MYDRTLKCVLLGGAFDEDILNLPLGLAVPFIRINPRSGEIVSAQQSQDALLYDYYDLEYGQRTSAFLAVYKLRE